MADNLTDLAEARALNFLTGNAGATAPTLPLMVRLMTANGSDSAPGTEVANSGGSTYSPQTVSFPAAVGSGSPVGNTADLVFSNMPACTVVGVEIWDSNGSPFRWWWGAATNSQVVNAAGTVRIVAGTLTVSMQ
jgi:hypothetical protein